MRPADLSGLPAEKCRRIAEGTDLIDIAACLEGERAALWFDRPGDAGLSLAGNVMGSRSRLAQAFGTTSEGLVAEVLRRLRTPQPVVEIDPAEAPVRQVVLTGDDADLTRLPVHLQHELDGVP